MTKATKSKAAPKPQEFEVVAYVTISVSKRIKATSREEALKRADGLGLPGLCHQCEGAGADYEDSWEINGLDGTPKDLKIVEE